ncbi:HlyD family efflux transporter periplasmic adaptor subunit [Sphingomonas koreensis]
MSIWGRRGEVILAGIAVSLLGGCGNKEQVPPPQAVEVAVAKALMGPVAVSDELPGRVVAYRIAEIRPQVGGIVQRRMFEQGGQVRAGQPLFQINPAPFLAEAGNAAATLQRAEATYSRARIQAENSGRSSKPTQLADKAMMTPSLHAIRQPPTLSKRARHSRADVSTSALPG